MCDFKEKGSRRYGVRALSYCSLQGTKTELYQPLSRRAQGALLIRLWIEVLRFQVIFLGGLGRFAPTPIFLSRDIFGICFDAWFDSPSRYRFLVLSDLFWASLRD